jgi:hypothetical protein
MMEGFIERLYPYTGDRRTITFLQSLVDYELENGLTPENYAWAGVPYASADPGAKKYTGWSQMGKDYLQPHVVGEDGYGYLRLYEITGNTKYLRAAIRCADALVKNYALGNATNSPWPVRLHARDGSTDPKAFGTYSANVMEPIRLFDELIRLNQGDVSAYGRVRAGAWQWFLKYPVANDTWVGYFEDTAASMGNMNQVIPLEFARYVILHPEKDPQWQQHALHIIQWVKSTPKWPKFIVHDALITTEQGDGKQYCCNDPGQCCDSHTSRLAAAAVLQVLTVHAPSSGPRVAEFEKEFAKYCGAGYGLAVSNATAGLHLALIAAGVGPGDEVITTSISWISTANAAAALGAKVVFADVDPISLNLDSASVAHSAKMSSCGSSIRKSKSRSGLTTPHHLRTGKSPTYARRQRPHSTFHRAPMERLYN